NYDACIAIAVDSSGSAYITGNTMSTSFSGAPAGGAHSASGGLGDAFVAKLNPAGSALSYFTYLGAASVTWANGIALDLAGNAYIGGYTSTAGLATAGAAQTAIGGDSDGF